MIIEGQQTPELRKESQRNFNKFNLMNGASYMCLGDTVIILLALQLGAPNWFGMALGSMMYVGFLLLLLGKYTTARVGASRSQAIFWVLRNITALMVASTVFLQMWFGSMVALAVLLFGAFLFYGFRAAGVVMSQPLIGDVTTDEDRGKFIGDNVAGFYAAAFVTLCLIIVLLGFSAQICGFFHVREVWLLAVIIVFGSMIGVSSSRYLSRVYETRAIMNSARQPLLGGIRFALQNNSLRRLFYAGFVSNLAILMTTSACVLILKRGYGVSDQNALCYSLVSLAASLLMSYGAAYLSSLIGPRRVMLVLYCVLIGVSILWVLMPSYAAVWFLGIPFLICGGASTGISNAMGHYYLQVTPAEQRVVGSVLMSVITGAGAGVFGLIVSALSLKLLGTYLDLLYPSSQLQIFKFYFLFTGLLLTSLSPLLLSLKPLPVELRQRILATRYVNDLFRAH